MKLLHIAAPCPLLLGWPAAPRCAGFEPHAPAPVTSGRSGDQPPAVIPGGPLQPITAAEAASRGVAQLEPPADLWERIRRGFAMPNLDSDLVRQQEQWYSSRPDYIQRMTERSRKYLFHIVEELERRNMPTELALLPFIESAFNPQAVSSARAAGMWQFMPATGQLLRTQAERLSRRPARRAGLHPRGPGLPAKAARHVRRLAPGAGGLQLGRRQRRPRHRAQPEDAAWAPRYADLNMPNETRYYVPKLQAVKNIVADPERSRRAAADRKPPLFPDRHRHARHRRRTGRPAGGRFRRATSRRSNPSMNRPVILAAGTPRDPAALGQRQGLPAQLRGLHRRPVRKLDRVERARPP